MATKESGVGGGGLIFHGEEIEFNNGHNWKEGTESVREKRVKVFYYEITVQYLKAGGGRRVRSIYYRAEGIFGILKTPKENLSLVLFFSLVRKNLENLGLFTKII